MILHLFHFISISIYRVHGKMHVHCTYVRCWHRILLLVSTGKVKGQRPIVVQRAHKRRKRLASSYRNRRGRAPHRYISWNYTPRYRKILTLRNQIIAIALRIHSSRAHGRISQREFYTRRHSALKIVITYLVLSAT